MSYSRRRNPPFMELDFAPHWIGLIHQAPLQGYPVAHSGVTSHVQDNRPCVVELPEMIQRCRLDGNVVKGWDLDVAYRSGNQPPPLRLAGWFLFFVVLTVDRNLAASV